MLTLKLHDKQTVVVCPLLEKQTVVVCPLLKINDLIYYFISVQTLSNFSLILIYSFCLNVHFYDNEFQYRSFKNKLSWKLYNSSHILPPGSLFYNKLFVCTFVWSIYKLDTGILHHEEGYHVIAPVRCYGTS